MNDPDLAAEFAQAVLNRFERRALLNDPDFLARVLCLAPDIEAVWSGDRADTIEAVLDKLELEFS